MKPLLYFLTSNKKFTTLLATVFKYPQIKKYVRKVRFRGVFHHPRMILHTKHSGNKSERQKEFVLFFYVMPKMVSPKTGSFVFSTDSFVPFLPKPYSICGKSSLKTPKSLKIGGHFYAITSENTVSSIAFRERIVWHKIFGLKGDCGYAMGTQFC